MSNAYIDHAVVQTLSNYTPAAGSNRILAMPGFVAKDTGTPTWVATIGAASFIALTPSAYVGDFQAVCFYIKEANIPVGSSLITVTPVGGTQLVGFYGAIYTLGGRDQTSPIDTSFSTSGSASGTTGFTTASITNAANSFLLGALRLAPADTPTARPSGWIQRATNTTSQLASIEDRDDAPGATGALTWTLDVTADWIYRLDAFKAISAATSKPNFTLLGVG